MTELRQAPDKPDPRFWDGEARKLMLMKYDLFRTYSTGAKLWTPNSRGARGLRYLGFRNQTKTVGGKVSCPIVAAYGQLLVNACQRVARQIEREQVSA